MLWWTLRQLKSSDESRRVQAAWKLAAVEDTRIIEPLLEALSDSASEVRKLAARGLGSAGDKRVMDPLAALLHDNDIHVREEAICSLSKFDSSEVTELLIAALQNQFEDVRWRAIQTLRQITPGPSVETLAEFRIKRKLRNLKSKTKTIKSLRPEDQRTVAAIVALRNDDSARIRLAVAKTIGQIGDDDAISSLVTLLKDQDEAVQKSAATALKGVEVREVRRALNEYEFAEHRREVAEYVRKAAEREANWELEMQILEKKLAGKNCSRCAKALKAPPCGSLVIADPDDLKSVELRCDSCGIVFCMDCAGRSGYKTACPRCQRESNPAMFVLG